MKLGVGSRLSLNPDFEASNWKNTLTWLEKDSKNIKATLQVSKPAAAQIPPATAGENGTLAEPKTAMPSGDATAVLPSSRDIPNSCETRIWPDLQVKEIRCARLAWASCMTSSPSAFLAVPSCILRRFSVPTNQCRARRRGPRPGGKAPAKRGRHAQARRRAPARAPGAAAAVLHPAADQAAAAQGARRGARGADGGPCGPAPAAVPCPAAGNARG